MFPKGEKRGFKLLKQAKKHPVSHLLVKPLHAFRIDGYVIIFITFFLVNKHISLMLEKDIHRSHVFKQSNDLILHSRV